jgi:hypothetical protein
LVELRAMKVRELKEGFRGKEELVQALIQAVENTADFSVSEALGCSLASSRPKGHNGRLTYITWMGRVLGPHSC